MLIVMSPPSIPENKRKKVLHSGIMHGAGPVILQGTDAWSTTELSAEDTKAPTEFSLNFRAMLSASLLAGARMLSTKRLLFTVSFNGFLYFSHSKFTCTPSKIASSAFRLTKGGGLVDWSSVVFGDFFRFTLFFLITMSTASRRSAILSKLSLIRSQTSPTPGAGTGATRAAGNVSAGGRAGGIARFGRGGGKCSAGRGGGCGAPAGGSGRG